eukprot:2325621-Pleurochrysis_carterae.AAC.2
MHAVSDEEPPLEARGVVERLQSEVWSNVACEVRSRCEKRSRASGWLARLRRRRRRNEQTARARSAARPCTRRAHTKTACMHARAQARAHA